MTFVAKPAESIRGSPPGPGEPWPFDDASAIRRVHNEGALLLGAGRALLLQIAHPAVAAGVAEHSSFRKRRIERLLRTLRPTLAMVFGDRDQALAAAASINGVHRGVIGAGYSARDPDLLLYVLATLIDTTLLVHDRFVRPLTRDEAGAYYNDMKLIGTLLGIPSAHLPRDIEAFRAYFDGAIGALRVNDTSRSLAHEIFDTAPALSPVLWPMKHLTAGLLPPHLRDEFGLSWGPKREAALDALATLSRRLLPVTPRPLRRPPWFLLP
ncbi:MAG TPA: oxygenase MpaB family protein [Dehalococcoidia bacterium]|nr:oxygenase MpaB family protein [Dehalococcoidia bacterium]